MTSHAIGTFEVKVKPLPADEKVDGLTVGRVALGGFDSGRLSMRSIPGPRGRMPRKPG